MDSEGIDESEYGYLEKWLIAKSDNKLQMYLDGRRAKWAELWPWQSPLITRCPSVKTHPITQHSLNQLQRYSRPAFRSFNKEFRKNCADYVHNHNYIDIIYSHHRQGEINESISL